MVINATFTTPVQSREWTGKSGAKGVTNSVTFVESSARALENFQGELCLELSDDEVRALGKDLRGATADIVVRSFNGMRGSLVLCRGEVRNVKPLK